ncbi:SDR family oxidoreductase [Corynebacterium sp. sy017]|uniref:SDR family oxidoreductase n=1 Tax=unclassified Corynebacterium TaxID=2624378 RepID=UPI001185311D|nr:MULTISPECIES: SDR family oxidoreductase [unclassified Corynebacterium]MBP3089091.1 SDR family oxidoreductase [Corynebacterium sp. sy017]TSD91405.1 SDR family oxidoreductase [Corynebacterium sp. SY003]
MASLTLSPGKTVLIIGGTGSVGRHVVNEAQAAGYSVRCLVRSHSRTAMLPQGVDIVVGDLTQAHTLESAVADVDGIIFTHGSSTSTDSVRDIDYAGVAHVLRALGTRRIRIALMTAVGVTAPGMGYREWKRRSEELLRASGHEYTIIRPGWFDYNSADQHRILLRQGDTRRAGSPADGVIAREQIARVLVASMAAKDATNVTAELEAEQGAEQENIAAVFSGLEPDEAGSLHGIHDRDIPDMDTEPQRFREDLEKLRF